MLADAPTDHDLIGAYLSGNQAALSYLWMRYDSMVYGLAHSIVCSKEAAEDIRQDVFLKVHKGLNTLREKEKFAGWVCTITRNTSNSWLRRQKPTQILEENTASTKTGVEQQIEHREHRTLLRKMIDQLPENLRTVVELHYFEEQRIRDIGQFLDLPETTVKWRLHKARETLQNTARINEYTE